MSNLLSAGLQLGSGLIGSMFQNRAAKKQLQAQFKLNYQAFEIQRQLNDDTYEYQKSLSDKAYSQQQALLSTQNQEVRLLNDRVDAFNRDILANHSTNVTKTDDESSSSGHIDFGALVRDAEAAGFNPLTVLRAGGAAGYSVTNVKSTNTVSQKVARDLMTYFAPSQAPQGPGQAQAPAAQVNNPGQAPAYDGSNPFAAFFDELSSMTKKDPNAAARQQVELELAKAQLANINSDTALNKYRLRIPSWTGSSTVSSSGGFKGKVNSTLGGVATPTPGEVKVTNPWPTSWNWETNPNVTDAAGFEDRYGENEVGSMLAGIGILGSDMWHNGKRLGNYIANTSTVKSIYNKLLQTWEKGSAKAPPAGGVPNLF